MEYMVDLNKKSILVTGGCGFIGSNFIEYLYKNYNDVTIINLDKYGIGYRKLSFKPLNGNLYVEINDNLCDLYQWNGFMASNKIDYVFHFAAESHVDRSISSPLKFIENNVMAMTSLLEWIKNKQPNARVINISTDEVYGHLQAWEAPFTEKSPLNPRSPYSASKAASDLIAKSYVETFGLDVITTRCCNNYGPHQADEKFIPTIIRNIVNETPIPVYGNGKNIREWIFVEDHNRSILEIAEKGYSGNVYNIGSGVEKENLEIMNDIIKIVGKPAKFDFVTDRKGHDFRYSIDSIRYFPEVGRRNYQDALEETVQHYLKKYGNAVK